MRQRILTIVLSVAAILLADGLLPIADAGSLSGRTIRRSMNWEPDCYKPYEPSFYIHDLDSYNLAVDEFNLYLVDIRSYLSCLESEAEQDARTVVRAISDSADSLRDDVLSDAEMARSNLEFGRLMLE